MIEINVTVDIEPIEIDVAVDLVPPSGGGVTVHNLLTGRDAAEAHPGSSISLDAVEWSNVQAMAEALDENEAIAVDGVTIIGAGTLADPYKVDQRVQFFATEQIDDFTITADMLYKLVYINSASPVIVTVDNMTVGSWIPFDTLGAGLPEFQIGGVNIFPDDDFTGATSFILIRLENDGVTERYGVKYG